MANEQNLIPIQTESQAREKGRAGGIASGKARRERKTIAEALRLVLAERGNEQGLSRQELIVARVVKRLYDEGDIRDLKVLADVLGESEETINVKGVAPIVAADSKDAAEIADLLEQVRKRKEGEQD